MMSSMGRSVKGCVVDVEGEGEGGCECKGKESVQRMKLRLHVSSNLIRHPYSTMKCVCGCVFDN